jgi:hypothetical protein
MLRWLKTVVVGDEEKAPGEVSGGDQEAERKRTAVDVSKSGGAFAMPAIVSEQTFNLFTTLLRSS